MSGPVSPDDAPPGAHADADPRATDLEITESHVAQVGDMAVRRALPRRARRTVGAWCFVDHMGPTTVEVGRGIDIGPHPHMGLQTVTWLLAGEVLHRDSLGSEQLIRPGQLNLMTAGHGVSHAEEGTRTYGGEVHGVQLWVAQPAATRDDAPAFEHHASLPQADLARAGGGSGGTGTVLVGGLGEEQSTARRDTDHLGVDLDLAEGTVVLPADARAEHALVVLSGALEVDGRRLDPGHLGYLGTGRDELALTALEPTRALLIGGTPFETEPLMWWNFVGRTRDEIADAWTSWTEDDHRFGTVASALDRIPVGPPPWLRST